MRQRGDWEKDWDLCSQHLGQVGQSHPAPGSGGGNNSGDTRWISW